MMTLQAARTLVSDLLDEVWEAEDPEPEFAYTKFMKVGTFKRAEQVNYRTGGFGMPVEREVLEDVDYDTPLFGETQRIVPLNWGRAFRIAEETLEDLADAGPTDATNAARLFTYGDWTKRLRRKCIERVDLECALKLINGTSTAAKYVGRDAVALFSASQVNLDNPPLTQSNINTAASFTAANLMTAITAIKNQRDDRGSYISTRKKFKLVHGSALTWKVIEVLKTSGQVDTANNTVNAIRHADLTIEPVEAMSLDRANGSQYTGWFLMNDAHELHWDWRKKPAFSKDGDFDANALKYKVTMRGNHYHKDWRGIVGHPPS
jgi:hypothetical protein